MIIVGVSVAPLILGTAGMMYEWVKLSGALNIKKAERYASAGLGLVHLTLLPAASVYAVGAGVSLEVSSPSDAARLSGAARWEQAGSIIYLIVLVALTGAYVASFRKLSTRTTTAFPVTIGIALAALFVRVVDGIYVAFNWNVTHVNPVLGSTELRAVLFYLPQSLAMVFLLIGGLRTIGESEREYDAGRGDAVRNATAAGNELQNFSRESEGNDPLPDAQNSQRSRFPRGRL